MKYNLEYYSPEINLAFNMVAHLIIGIVFFIALTYSIRFVLGAIKFYLNVQYPEKWPNKVDNRPYEQKLIIACIFWTILYIL